MIATVQELERQLAGKIARLQETNNYPAEVDRTDYGVMHVTTYFPKHLPPPGIKYSKNFQNWQNAGRFAVQVK